MTPAGGIYQLANTSGTNPSRKSSTDNQIVLGHICVQKYDRLMDIAGGNQDIANLLTNYGSIGIAVGPLAASMVARLVFGKSKMVTNTLRLSTGWLAARAFLTPHVDQMQQTLVALNSLVHGNGFN